MSRGNGDVPAKKNGLARILRLARIREAKNAQEEVRKHLAEVERAKQRRIRKRRQR